MYSFSSLDAYSLNPIVTYLSARLAAVNKQLEVLERLRKVNGGAGIWGELRAKRSVAAWLRGEHANALAALRRATGAS